MNYPLLDMIDWAAIWFVFGLLSGCIWTMLAIARKARSPHFDRRKREPFP